MDYRFLAWITVLCQMACMWCPQARVVLTKARSSIRKGMLGYHYPYHYGVAIHLEEKRSACGVKPGAAPVIMSQTVKGPICELSKSFICMCVQETS